MWPGKSAGSYSAGGKGTQSRSVFGETSKSQHGWHMRRLQDLPIQGVPVMLDLRAGRWKCRNERCARKTFMEKLGSAAVRKTRRVGELVRLFGMPPEAGAADAPGDACQRHG